MWSLAAEVAFYAILPLLMALGVGRSLRTGRVLVLLLGLVAVSVTWHLGLGNAVDEASPGLASSWLPGYLGWFAVGIALALAHVEHQRSGDTTWWVRQLRLLGSMPGTCWALAAGLLLLAATPLAGPSLLFVATPGESLFKHLDYALVAALLVVTGVFGASDQHYTRVMSTPALRHLGHISYSTFCIHLIVLHGVMAAGDFPLFGGHGWQIWSLTLVLSLVASEVLYRLVELPALRLRGSPLAWRAVPDESAEDQPRGSRQAASTR
jgi:peptidoglycan/LPS O-acetylase OafA/YrhL